MPTVPVVCIRNEHTVQTIAIKGKTIANLKCFSWVFPYYNDIAYTSGMRMKGLSG